MFLQLLRIFVDIIAPVFGLALLGYLAGPRLGLDARTITRYAYYLLVPAFVFDLRASARLEAGLAVRMVVFIVLVELGCALLGFLVARALGRPPKMVGAYVLIAVFGNVGNFGLPIVEFSQGQAGLVAATIYFLAISTVSFLIGVTAAGWASGGRRDAVWTAFRTPGVLAILPAILVNGAGVELPIAVDRALGLLSGAMVPTMLVALGVQLAGIRSLRFTGDMVWASGVRLLGGPLLALGLAGLFGLEGVTRAAGVLQAGMPAAVLTAIIAMEHDLVPDFVTPTVLLSTLFSLMTLTLLLAML